MADEINKKVLIEVDITNGDAQSSMAQFKQDVDAAAASLIAAKTAIAAAKQATAELAQATQQSKLEQQQAKTAIDQARLAQTEATIAMKNAKQATEAASGSYKEAQQNLTKLGNAIKNTKDGFNSTDPVLKAQIADYNKLNSQLKAFDAQMGNHQRNVGNYQQALQGINGVISKLVPGFNQFQGLLQNAAKGFNAMGTEANVATEASEGLTGAMGGLVIVVAAVAAGLFAVVNFLMQYAKWSDIVAGSTEGVKAYWNAQLNGVNATKASIQAFVASGLLNDLDRQLMVAKQLTAEEDAHVRNLMLKMRDRATTGAQAEVYFQEALKITGDQYERNNKLAKQHYEVSLIAATAGKKVSVEEYKSLADLSKGYDVVLKKAKELVDADKLTKDAIEKITTGIGNLIAVDAQKENRDQMLQNRNDAKQAKADAAAEKERAKIEEINRLTEQANSERIASMAKTLEFQQEAFGRELSATDEHYRQLIFKQEQFIEKMRDIQNDPKSTGKERSAAGRGMSAGQAAIGQITQEKASALEKIIEDHNRKVLAETQSAANDLRKIQIASIEDNQERDRQANELEYTEQTEAYKRQLSLLTENKEKLANQMKTAKGNDLKLLADEYAEQDTLIKIANDKQTEEQEKYQKNKVDQIKKYAAERELALDETKVLQRTDNAEDNPSRKNEKALLDAEKEQLLDKRNAELLNEHLTDEQKLLINQQYYSALDALDRQAKQKMRQFEIEEAQQVADASFQIIEQSLARQMQAQEVALEKQKNYDLSNQALTATQRYEIEEKYRVKTGQLKVKEFHEEQELSIAKAIINTALGVTKAIPDPLEMALAATAGALEIAVIAAQRAPAYAQGGTFESNGRGAILPGYSRTDNTNARLRSGEAVIVSEAVRDPWARSVLSAINHQFGGVAFDRPAFASGGVFSNYTPTADNGLRQQISVTNNTRLHPDDISQVVGGISNAMQKAKFVTDVKDVNRQQNLLSYVTDRLTK